VIYGSDARTADALRSHTGGRLQTSPGDLLPFNNTTYFPNIHDAATAADPTASCKIANDAHLVPDSQLFMAGDVRVNENIELTSVQTLLMREHNRIADEIHEQNPSFGDQQIYQMARAIVIAEEQVITFQEWLPALLGAYAVDPYAGYDGTVNPGIANEFSTAAFRVGHTLLAPDVQFLNPDGTTQFPAVSLANAFFNPPIVVQTGVDPILKYLGTDNAQEVDNKIVPELQNFLFGPPGAGGLDLASLNIQRGRDHGIADYNTVRDAYGLPRVGSFADITSNPDLQAKLQQLYGNVNNIDLWVGGLTEDHVPGGSVGPLFTRIIADQFEHIRNGDRLWYQNLYSGDALDALQHVSLAQIVARNTVNRDLQPRLFFFRPEIRGTVFKDTNHDGLRQIGEAGVAGRTINLMDDTGAIVATTVTDANGIFRFTLFNGVGTGTFTVAEVLPAGVFQTTGNPPAIKITRGEIVSGVDFGNSTVQGPGTPVTPHVSAAFDVQDESVFDVCVDTLEDYLRLLH
jgi:peroxidase